MARWLRRFHLLMMTVWLGLSIPGILWWRESILFVIILSLYANFVSGGVYYTPVRQKNQQPCHRVRTQGHERVQALLAMCWPWLSDTKRAQAVRALDAHRARKRAYVNHHAAKTHCPQGHPYAGDNLRIEITPSGGQKRQCRACASESYDRRRDVANAQARERYRRKRLAMGKKLRRSPSRAEEQQAD